MKTKEGVRYLSLDDSMPFGKYKNRDTKLWQIIKYDTDYATWMIENLNNWTFDNEAFEEYQKTIGQI